MNNIEIYNDRMRKSILDKIFFLDKIDASVFIDFGCADGSMIRVMSEMYPENIYIGYDNNHDMVKLAERNLTDKINCFIFSDWSQLLNYITEIYNSHKKCLILSSVLHEVENKSEFFDFLKLGHFDYLAIRDMMFIDMTNSNKPSIFSLSGIYHKLPVVIRDRLNSKNLYPENMIQGAFKSYYMENIDTEINEDYFSFTELEMKKLETSQNLSVIYKHHYLLPYWRDTIKRDFSTDLNGFKTHVQLIYLVKNR